MSISTTPTSPQTTWPLRLACESDVPALEALLPQSVFSLQAGFRTVDIVAALAGEPLYAAFGYAVVERYGIPLAGDLSLPVVRMTKRMQGA